MKTIVSFILPILTLGLTPTNAQTEVPIEDVMFSDKWYNDIDEALANADKVRYLDLSLQKLRQFPTEILKLKNLTHLYLPFNYFPSIPAEIAQLENLEELDLSGTYYLNSLPKELANLKNLKKLLIKDNMLSQSEEEKIIKLLPNCEVIVSDHK